GGPPAWRAPQTAITMWPLPLSPPPITSLWPTKPAISAVTPVSSCSSRMAAQASVSPYSTRPPGKLQQPAQGGRLRRTSRTSSPRHTATLTPSRGRERAMSVMTGDPPHRTWMFDAASSAHQAAIRKAAKRAHASADGHARHHALPLRPRRESRAALIGPAVETLNGLPQSPNTGGGPGRPVRADPAGWHGSIAVDPRAAARIVADPHRGAAMPGNGLHLVGRAVLAVVVETLF